MCAKKFYYNVTKFIITWEKRIIAHFPSFQRNPMSMVSRKVLYIKIHFKLKFKLSLKNFTAFRTLNGSGQIG
jgi:hypothetical protein